LALIVLLGLVVLESSLASAAIQDFMMQGVSYFEGWNHYPNVPPEFFPCVDSSVVRREYRTTSTPPSWSFHSVGGLPAPICGFGYYDISFSPLGGDNSIGPIILSQTQQMTTRGSLFLEWQHYLHQQKWTYGFTLTEWTTGVIQLYLVPPQVSDFTRGHARIFLTGPGLSYGSGELHYGDGYWSISETRLLPPGRYTAQVTLTDITAEMVQGSLSPSPITSKLVFFAQSPQSPPECGGGGACPELADLTSDGVLDVHDLVAFYAVGGVDVTGDGTVDWRDETGLGVLAAIPLTDCDENGAADAVDIHQDPLLDIDFDGRIDECWTPYDSTAVTIVEPNEPTAAPGAPHLLTLGAYPNPFNASTSLSFTALPDQSATLEIVALDGRILRTLHSGLVPEHEVTLPWDGRDAAGHILPAGLYLARLHQSAHVRTTRLILLK